MVRGASLLALAALTADLAGQEKPADVDLKVVQYAGLVDVVKQHKGKVILIDFRHFTIHRDLSVTMQKAIGDLCYHSGTVNMDKSAFLPC